ncbi:hypothetical protein [Bacillus sp. T33-2]|uniref:hypothetical protein n=1 Tax=Bacillus sp. T33-2 TaxID=2054168 RepID=UPI000C78A674|nr:hypothetical protein [Bacillus sp. T33-2]PLR94842.1 hypothetical protein CVD19_16345 [Bacillus sp. T33-2]
MARRKYTKEQWTYKFIGEGEEDLINILKRQFVRWINEQHAYPVIALKDDIIKEHFQKEYKNRQK